MKIATNNNYNHFARQLKSRRKEITTTTTTTMTTSERFVYDMNASHDPYVNGLLPHSNEWLYECVTHKRAENLFIYGTNSWGQYLVIEVKWRPRSDGQHVTGFVSIQYKHDEQSIYEMTEQDVIKLVSNNNSNDRMMSYKFAGLMIELMSPFRKLRIKFSGYLRRRDTNQLVFVRFQLFWTSISNIFDFQTDFDDQFIAKELNGFDANLPKLLFENRYEQFGYINGLVQLESEPNNELYLWGCRAKTFLDDKHESRVKATRVYGFSKNGFAFHVGCVNFDSVMNYRYGHTYFAIAPVFALSDTTFALNAIELITKSSDIVSQIKFAINVKSEVRTMDITLDKICDIDANIMIFDMKLNESSGKAIIVIEDNTQEIIDCVEIPQMIENNVKNLVFVIGDEESKHRSYSGGKGSSLSLLHELSKRTDMQFTVPRGLIVTTNSYHYLIEQNSVIKHEIDSLETLSWSEKRDNLEESCHILVTNISNTSLTKKIENEITAQLTTLFGINYDKLYFAVRSSACDEDSDEMSHAGQMTTYLGVRGIEEICQTVMKCWASQFSFAAVEYKRGFGQPINSPMAVVIQQMVDCDASGVTFTCNPLTGDEREIIITANYGIGESVVAAIAEPDNIVVNVDIQCNSLEKERQISGISSIEIGSKLKQIKMNQTDGGTSVMLTDDDNNASTVCCLNENEILNIARLSLEVHRFYGNARDIEWGIKDKRIYLFQSRAITNLEHTFTEWELMHDCDSGQASELEYFSRANFGEIFPGAQSYICLSWLTHVWFISLKSFKHMFNFTKKDFCPFHKMGNGVISNQIFMSLNNGSPPFSSDPNSSFGKGLQLSFYGHEIKDSQLFVECKERSSRRPMPAKNKLLTAGTMSGVMFSAKKNLLKFRNRVIGADLINDREFKSAKELFDHIVTNSEIMHSAIDATFYCSMSSMIANTMLINILLGNRKDGESEKNFFSDYATLVSGLTSDVISGEVPNALREISSIIENSEQFCAMSDEEALNYLRNGDTKCSVKFNEFLAKHGHRGYKEFDVLVLQWQNNTLPLINIIKSMILDKSSALKPTQQISIDQKISSLKTPLSGFKKFLLKHYVLPRCKQGFGLREQGKYTWIWTVNIYRKAFWLLARMMVSEGSIPDADLLFYLTIDELERLIAARDAALVARAKARRRIHPKKDALIFEELVIGPVMKPRNESVPNDFDSNIDVSLKLSGTPVCLGKVKARVFVAMNVTEAKHIQFGDILVTYSTDIGWSPYFPLLSGLVTEIGGLISHGAVIARELGLPCIVGVKGVLRRLKTGDTLLLDADNGEITRIDCS